MNLGFDDIKTVGICGLGYVGHAIYVYFQDHPLIEKVVAYDKYKNIGDPLALLQTDILFLCLPTPLSEDNHYQYDVDELSQTLKWLTTQGFNGHVIIKSTVTPLHMATWSKDYPSLQLYHNPEFLSAKTAVEDYRDTRHIVLGYTSSSRPLVAQWFQRIFPKALISVTSSTNSTLMKLACNSFYATKVQFFTELYLLCAKLQHHEVGSSAAASFDSIRDLMLKNGWINPMHTEVPGPDGHPSFAGMCLPKDLAALCGLANQFNSPAQVVSAALAEQQSMRRT
jgi:UDP-glucose 6-dehydrogenase